MEYTNEETESCNIEKLISEFEAHLDKKFLILQERIMERTDKENLTRKVEQPVVETEEKMDRQLFVIKEENMKCSKVETGIFDAELLFSETDTKTDISFAVKERSMDCTKKESETSDGELPVIETEVKIQQNFLDVNDESIEHPKMEVEEQNVPEPKPGNEEKVGMRLSLSKDRSIKNAESESKTCDVESTVTETREDPSDLNSSIDFTLAKKKKNPENEAKMGMRLSLSKDRSIKNAESESKTCDVESTVTEIREDSSDLNSSIDFTLAKKKKKKKVKFAPETTTFTASETNTIPRSLDNLPKSDPCVFDSDNDYTYEYLLTRAFNMMREKNPNLDEEVKKKLIMKPPQVLRAGAKKTSFANFLEICKVLHRAPQHLQSYLLAEFGTTGSVDGNNQLVIKGRFQQKQIESVLRKYIREYVTCHTCHSPATVLQRDTRLCFLQCETCGSRCSVASIKSGFQAVINKRAATRAKAV